MHRSRATYRMRGDRRREDLLSHGGTALLTKLADRSGLTKAMSLFVAECGISWHTHDPGVVLTHSAVAMTDGAGCLAGGHTIDHAA